MLRFSLLIIILYIKKSFYKMLHIMRDMFGSS